MKLNVAEGVDASWFLVDIDPGGLSQEMMAAYRLSGRPALGEGNDDVM